MSVTAIDTVVLLFPNGEWSSTETDAALTPIVSQLRPNISFTQHVDDNLQTLSTTNANRDGTIGGFLYVPDLVKTDACYNISKSYIPKNATRQANLPPTDFNLIALAPWISPECTLAYMAAAHLDPAHAFLFYQPLLTNDTSQLPHSGSETWNLQDGGAWKKTVQFPVYTVSTSIGIELMHQLALYSGNMTTVPYGHAISELPDIDPRDYVRLFTQISESCSSDLPGLWAFFLIVLAVLVFVLGIISVAMHLIQRAHRHSLHRRVTSGDVNLEALGIKRLTVPQQAIEKLPLFIYVAEEKSPPTSPQYQGRSNSAILGRRVTISSGEQSLSQVAIIDDTISNPTSVLIHKFLPYSQPTCPICLEDFVSGVTEIRELPCGHIFHLECIDIFLGSNSSLCPMCKKSALPVGYCPTEITNAMVRRERNLRKLRSRITIVEDRDLEPSATRRRYQELKSKVKRNVFSMPSSPSEPPFPLEPQPVFMTPVIRSRQQSLLEDTSSIRSPSRREIIEQRIQELTAGQTPIRDPDILPGRARPKWRKWLSGIFPGFS